MKSILKPIGGFFELEIQNKDYTYHSNAIALSNGRACLNLILKHIHAQRIWIPFYTCNALLEPIKTNQIPYSFYSININLEPTEDFKLKKDEYLIYINYFGLKGKFIKALINQYNDQIIIDNTQAFFERENSKTWSFNSARKFFGVPDGAYLYTPYDIPFDYARNTDLSCDHLFNRLLGKQKQAYQEFIEYEKGLDDEIKMISIFSECLLANIDYLNIAKKRRCNFNYYHSNFEAVNQFNLPLAINTIPYHYPLLVNNQIDKSLLYEQNIFIPILWKDTIQRELQGFDFEKNITQKLIALPIDHRYEIDELDYVIKSVKELLRI
ncbi:hypothetical protein [Nostoc sp. 'Peltigera membranacea cyanobiont' 232]|uniref:hypothetical protein n=1 Tax=Nostoc sp. 'Peltigera membranacea cyanobiont' 232 TaxID=2014531 RepID=UPI000B95C60B|nr:hypothetical protein [Nostoc sp. 'Peltigera membranacea cyanobiont' 232]OYE04421.1 hypothetical protein CDG79_13240 [Nostoc sp. 'Peltigera membranacea cyanobiont' 232]